MIPTDNSSSPNRPVRALWICLLAVAVFMAFQFSRIGEPPRFEGDFPSDTAALSAGRHFAEQGFTKTHFLPITQAGPMTEPPEIYTHFPPGPDILTGILIKMVGPNLPSLRPFPILATALAMLFWFGFFRRLGGDWVGVIAVLLLICSRHVLEFADSFHMHAFGELFRASTAYLLLRAWYDDGPRMNWRFFAAALLSFELLCWISPPATFWIVGLAIVLYLPWRKALPRTTMILFFAMPALMAALHVFQIILSYGEVQALIDEAARTAAYRTGADNALGPLDTFIKAFQGFNNVAPKYLFFPFWLLAVLAVTAFVAGFRLKQTDPHQTQKTINPVHAFFALLAASLTWTIVFSQHATGHSYFILHEWDYWLAYCAAAGLVFSLGAIQKRRLAVVAVTAALVIAFGFVASGGKWAIKPKRILSEAPVLHSAAQISSPYDVFFTNFIEGHKIGYTAWRRLVHVDTLEDFFKELKRVDKLKPDAWNPGLFFYRTWNKTSDEVYTDPLFIYLRENFSVVQVQPFAIFNLKKKLQPAEKEATDG
jgi:Dolichyl-phosphate-mannose-protein mannosyltransferase